MDLDEETMMRLFERVSDLEREVESLKAQPSLTEQLCVIHGEWLRSGDPGVEAGVAQNARERSGQSTPETAPAAVQAATEQRACNPEVPGSIPGSRLDSTDSSCDPKSDTAEARAVKYALRSAQDYWKTNNDGHRCARDGSECCGCVLRDALDAVDRLANPRPQEKK